MRELSNISLCPSLVRPLWGLFWVAGCLGVSVTSAAEDCESFGSDSYICGIPSAEDLVQVPGSPWIIASAYSSPPALNLINAQSKEWQPLYPVEDGPVNPDRELYADCPGAPDGSALITHGLDLVAGEGGYSTLYAVGHGGREAIEVFDVFSRGGQNPTITWVGCVLAPEGQEINSVAAMRDGSLLATIPLEEGQSFASALEGVVTGAAYHWSAASGDWSRLDATAQPYANGIALSADESMFYIASSGLANITAYRLEMEAERVEEVEALWTTETLPILPDNLHRDSAGHFVTAGLIPEYAACNPYNEAGEFELQRYATCPRPYKVLSLDPTTRAVSEVSSGGATPVFSNATMGLVVDDTAYVGTFVGDRVAYRKLDEGVE
ncbi:SMP-30/gluconolactonase/LRE family protein [Congregibacter sp.]|uniref:SMP-30/gluconolactonase/LRE family protein n=1 Tax=Congregibacter sp. TaxID=2744308 RepID=UPI003F6BF23C